MTRSYVDFLSNKIVCSISENVCFNKRVSQRKNLAVIGRKNLKRGDFKRRKRSPHKRRQSLSFFPHSHARWLIIQTHNIRARKIHHAFWVCRKMAQPSSPIGRARAGEGEKYSSSSFFFTPNAPNTPVHGVGLASNPPCKYFN